MLGTSDEAKEKGRSTRDALPLRTGDDARAWHVCDLLYAPASGWGTFRRAAGNGAGEGRLSLQSL
jgi:hypothetical protein